MVQSMVLTAKEIFNMPSQKMPPTDLVFWLYDAATLQESHPFHKNNWPGWVPGWVKYRDYADSIPALLKAAENKDRSKVQELDLYLAEVLNSIYLNANYIVLRSHSEKDESLLHNVGYTLKEQTKKNYGLATISATPLVLTVKNLEAAGEIAVKYERDPAAGIYQLQICKGAPVGEESWWDKGYYKSCRVVLANLDRASWYYFRVRSHGNNETSPWSAPVGIIVV